MSSGNEVVWDGLNRTSLMRVQTRKWVPLALLLAGLIAFFALGLHKYLRFEVLQENRAALLAWVTHHGFGAPVAYTVAYVALIAFSLPGGMVMTVAGGFLFGPVEGTILTVVGATSGATALFLVARSSLGEVLRERAGPGLKRMEAEFCENALSYLLVLRLVPLFPFWLVNLVPAFCGVTLRTFVIGTIVGIIPGTFVYTLVGNGLDAVLQAGGKPSLDIIFRPEVLLPLLGLALLALVPVVYRKVHQRRKPKREAAG